MRNSSSSHTSNTTGNSVRLVGESHETSRSRASKRTWASMEAPCPPATQTTGRLPPHNGPIAGPAATAASTTTTTTTTIVNQQNNQGVWLWEAKEFARAEQCFRQALLLLDPHEIWISLPPTTTSLGVALQQRRCGDESSSTFSTRTSATTTSTPTAEETTYPKEISTTDSTRSPATPPLSAASTRCGATAVHAPVTTPKMIDSSMDLDAMMSDLYSIPERIRPNGDDDGQPPSVIAATTILFNLAQSCRARQDYQGALSLFQRALDIVMHGTPPRATVIDQTIIIPTLHNIGWLLFRHGNIADARSCLKLALSHCHVLLGPRSLSVAVTLNFLGVLHFHVAIAASSLPDMNDIGKVASKSSIESLSQALDIFLHLFGPQTPVVARMQHCLGRALMQRQEFPLSLHYLVAALKTRGDSLGMDSVEYASSAYYVGQTLHHLNDLEGAMQMYQMFLFNPSVQKIGRHRDVALCLSGMAQIYEKRQEYDQAQRLYEQSLAVGRLALGPEHPEVALLLNRLGNFYFDRQVLDQALEAYHEGLNIERITCGESHPNLIVTILNIGERYKRKRDRRKAIQYFTEAMAMQRIQYGPNCTQVASVLNTLGLMHDQLGDTTSALKCLQEALVMRRTVLGDNHLDVSASLANVGTVLSRNDMLHSALQLFTECLRIRTRILGLDHRSVSLATYNMGLCQHMLGNYKEAKVYLNETLRIERLVLGEDHRDIALTLYKLGETYKMEAEIDLALEYYEQSLAMERRLTKIDHLAVAQTLSEIGNIHLFNGKIPHMMQAFVESARMFQMAGRLVLSVTISPDLNPIIGRSESLAAAVA